MESNSVCNHERLTDDTKFCHQLITTITKFVIFCAFQIKTQEIPGVFFFFKFENIYLSERVRWRVLFNYLSMTRTVLLVLKSGQLIANQI